MKRLITFLALCSPWVVQAAAPIGTNISAYPNTNVAPASSLILLAVTNQIPKTNYNIKISDFLLQATNGLATTGYVNTVSTTVSNGVITEIINASNSLSGNGFARLEVQTNGIRVGLVTNINWTYGMTGSVSGATAILGVDDSSANTIVSNGLVTLLTSATNSASSNIVNSDPNRFMLQAFPSKGPFYYIGTNGLPNTNGQRVAFEWIADANVLNFGALDNNNSGSRFIGAISNWWHPTNMGYGSIRFGSNSLVQSTYAAVLGGQFNQIANNSPASAIVTGTNNWISTNAPWSFVGGGSGNLIEIGTQLGFIGGGIDNQLVAGANQSFIGGGNANSISDLSLTACIVGGNDNDITGSGNSFSFIGGGQQNKIKAISVRSAIVGGDGNAIGDSSAAVRCFIGGGQRNLIRSGADQSSIVGGFNNVIFNSSPNSFIGGGWTNSIGDTSGGSVICSGISNIVGNAATNGLISGGIHNAIADSSKHSFIIGSSNAVSASASGIMGLQNGVTAARAIAIGTGVTNATSDSVMVGELISYNTPAVISGAGNGNTNYLLSVTSPMMLLGSSNVNIYGVAGTISGKTHKWSVNITNLSADTWGIRFDSGTNRWKFQSWMYGTNAPVVLTNNTLLRLQGESQGTNTLVTYQYFSPAL